MSWHPFFCVCEISLFISAFEIKITIFFQIDLLGLNIKLKVKTDCKL